MKLSPYWKHLIGTVAAVFASALGAQLASAPNDWKIAIVTAATAAAHVGLSYLIPGGNEPPAPGALAPVIPIAAHPAFQDHVAA